MRYFSRHSALFKNQRTRACIKIKLNTFKFEVTSESKYDQYKIKCLQNSLTKVREKFSGAEDYIEKGTEELCDEKRLSAEKVGYLFMNNHKV